jgi:hypothetical protein
MPTKSFFTFWLKEHLVTIRSHFFFMDEKCTWWPSSRLFPCRQLLQHIMATRCFFFLFINEKGTKWPPCVFFFITNFFFICSLGIRKALSGHHVIFFFALLTKMAPSDRQMPFFFSLSIRKTPNGHQMFFLCSLWTRKSLNGH